MKFANYDKVNQNGVIPENSLIGFAGPSGSGKSTLIDIILGLLIPNSGSLVLGENTISKNNTYLLQSRVGYVPQTIFLSDNTIKNNIAFAGIDMIGNHLTEINVTSPTGAKEIFDQSGVNPIELLFNKLL